MQAVPSEGGKAVEIQIEEDAGYEKVMNALRTGTLGTFLDGIRGGKPISTIIDFTSEKHPRFVRFMFSGSDSDDSGFVKGPTYINPRLQKNRIDLYRRLSDRGKQEFLSFLQPAIKTSLQNALQEKTEMARVGMKYLPQDVTRHTMGYLGGRRKRRKTRKARKSRKTRRV